MNTKSILTGMMVFNILVSAFCMALAYEPEMLARNHALFYMPVSFISAISACMFGLYSLRAGSASKTQ